MKRLVFKNFHDAKVYANENFAYFEVGTTTSGHGEEFCLNCYELEGDGFDDGSCFVATHCLIISEALWEDTDSPNRF